MCVPRAKSAPSALGNAETLRLQSTEGCVMLAGSRMGQEITVRICITKPMLVAARPLACWNCGFESRRGHGSLSVVSVVRRADHSSRGVLY